MKTIHRACTLCEAGCGLSYDVEGETITAVRADPDDVVSRGFVCAKGLANAELHSDPDRLRTPVRRTPSGDFEPIEWTEALGLAVNGLREVRERHGRKSLGLYFGNPLVHNPGALLARRGLVSAVGARRSFGTGSQDTSPRFATSYHLYGSSFVVPLPDLERTDFLLCLGANPVVSNGSFLTAPNIRERLRAIRRRGGRLVVVDPRRTETAREADEHIAILPGGDAALLLGMLGVLLREDRVDRKAIAETTNGFERVEAVVRALPPERLEAASGVAADTIARLAREFAEARTSVVYSRIGICNNRYGTLATFAVDLLNIAAGRLGRPGGALFSRPALDVARLSRMPGMDGHGRWHSRVRGLPETLGDLPGSCLAEEIETVGEGQIHGLVAYAGNPVVSCPNGQRIDRALAQLRFMVSIDPYVNETTRHAHVILPPASSLTEEHLDFFFPAFSIRTAARLSPAVFPRKAGELHDWEIMRALAEGLGGGFTGLPAIDGAFRITRMFGVDPGPVQIAGALLRTGRHGDRFMPFSRGLSLRKLRDAEHGIDLGPLEPGVKDRVQHGDGRVHLDAAPLIEALESFAGALPDRRTAGELLLIGRRDVRSNNSWMHNLPSLASGKDRCVLLVHPKDAEAAGVADGENGWLESRVHAGYVPVRVNADMRPGVVSLPHGWGHGAVGRFQRTAALKPGVSVNDWSDDAEVESVVGQSILNGVPVRLSRDRPAQAKEA
jgi:anaerobic selenocysteine-containing dehydrogenase